MITIDGSLGEGGGQILRTSLALSLVTGQAFRMEQIRARRSNPGLQRQHLTAVLAAAEVGQAEVQGAAIRSECLSFVPGRVRAGTYHFAVGTAGSATLVLQTILPALILADGPSQIELEGGTHNIYAPPFDFLQKTFLPTLARMGPRVEATLHCPGFYPAGGGRMSVRVEPCARLQPIELLERGPVVRRSVRSLISRLPRHVAQRELSTALAYLDWPETVGRVEEVHSPGPGNALIIEIETAEITEVFTAFGQRGVRAEAVAREAAEQARRYLDSSVPVGEHLADQLVLLLGLAGSGGFRTLPPSSHTLTNIDTLERFVAARIVRREVKQDVWEIRCA